MINAIVQTVFFLCICNVPLLFARFPQIIPVWFTKKSDFVLRKIGSTLVLMMLFDFLCWSLTSAIVGVVVYWTCWHFRFYLQAIILAIVDTGLAIIKTQVPEKMPKVKSFIKSYKAWEDKAVKPHMTATFGMHAGNCNTDAVVQQQDPHTSKAQDAEDLTETEPVLIPGQPDEEELDRVGGVQIDADIS